LLFEMDSTKKRPISSSPDPLYDKIAKAHRERIDVVKKRREMCCPSAPRNVDREALDFIAERVEANMLNAPALPGYISKTTISLHYASTLERRVLSDALFSKSKWWRSVNDWDNKAFSDLQWLQGGDAPVQAKAYDRAYKSEFAGVCSAIVEAWNALHPQMIAHCEKDTIIVTIQLE
jgi:hypothetical protein